MYSIGFYTLGCKVSQYETEAISEEFLRRGFLVRPFDDVCDAYVINTCTVTAESDRKSRQIARRAISLNPSAIVAVIGCYSQLDPDGVGAIDGVSLVRGTDGKMHVVDDVIALLSGERTDRVRVSSLDGVGFEPMAVKSAPRTRAYVKIEDGCESKCTYCAIKEARGRVRSKPFCDVISEVEALSASGTKEIVLTGIETGSYGRDLKEGHSLAELICELDRRKSCEVIRLGSLAPELIDRRFAERVADAKILAPHFHLSMQSGSDRILALMKRRYNTDMALRNIEAIKELIPRARFTTDLMVGFPGEDEEDFLATVDFVRRVGFIDAHVFAYSRREGTPAAYFDSQVSPDVKKRRSRELIRVKNEVRDAELSSVVESGTELIAIAESYDGEYYSAHTDDFMEVRFAAPCGIGGKRVTLTPVSHKSGVVTCKLNKIL